MRPSPIGGDAVLKATDISASGGEVASRVQTQLTGPADVKAAHAYFQPTGAETHLPAISGIAGADTSAMHVAGHLAGKATEGAALAMASKAGEGAAMSAAQQAGAQAVSPIIQMIMRMPGHLGLMSSFFEALGHFFLGQDILGGLSETAHLFVQQAEGAMHAISAAAGHMGINIELLPQGGGALFHGMTNIAGSHGALLTANSEFTSTLSKATAIDTSNITEVGRNALKASGYTDLPPELMHHSISSSMNDGSLPAVDANGSEKFVAWDTGSAAFRPTLSGVQPPLTTQMPQTVPPTPPSVSHPDPSSAGAHQPTHAAGHEVAKAHHEVAKPSHHAGGRGRLLDSGHAAPPEHSAQSHSDAGSDSAPEQTAAESTHDAGDAATTDGAHGDAPTHEYTVQHGDNLWDIARTHLGDANRWTEIFHLNQDVLGDNPAMIHEGTVLHLPGSDSVASGDYVVKPGDNLFEITQSKLGDGSQWTQVYHANQDLIGSNPNLIHPGQHLTLSTDAAHQHLASAPSAHAHSISHAPAVSGAAHTHHIVAQNHPHVSAAAQSTHHVAESVPSAGSHHAAESASHSIASAESAPTGAVPQGLHAQAGSLASLQSPAVNPAAKFESLSAE